MESTVESIAVHLYAQYSTEGPYEVYPDALHFLQNLHAKRRAKWYESTKVKLGIISNYDKRIIDLTEKLDLAFYFDFVTYSEESRCSKPEKQIFNDAIIKSVLKNLQPEEILHIGDDLKKDYLGAKHLGWNAILIQRNKEAKAELLGTKYLRTNFGEANIEEDICDDFRDVEAQIWNVI